MKLHFGRGAKFLAPAFIITLILVVASLALRQPAVNAGTPPPDVPDIEGEPFTAVLDSSIQVSRDSIESTTAQVGWVTEFTEDFENDISSPPWLNISVNAGPYTWGTEPIENTLDLLSTKVAWGVGTGVPELDPQQDGYPPNVDSWLVTGPFDFTDVVDGELTLDLYLDAVPGVPGDPTKPGNRFAVAISTDGGTYTGVQIIDGGNAEWTTIGQNLAEYAGESQVWFALIFKSDNQPNPDSKIGALIDNVNLSVLYPSKAHMPYIAYGFTPTPNPPTPTPTPTPVPNQDYKDDFTNTIVPWEPRLWTLGADYSLEHRADSDQDGRSGFLELEVKNKENYVIVSPLYPAKTYPYNIEFTARLMPKDGSDYPNDQAQYGVVFGADLVSEPCPASDFNTCFTKYYELRVRFRDTGEKHFLEYKLKRIEEHDANNGNSGPDIIDWTKVGADPKKFVEWDVNVSSDGEISISANDEYSASVKDDTYLDNRYFGLEVRTGNKDGSRTKFDYIKID